MCYRLFSAVLRNDITSSITWKRKSVRVLKNSIKKVDGLDAEQIKITLVRDATREGLYHDRVLIMRLRRKKITARIWPMSLFCTANTCTRKLTLLSTKLNKRPFASIQQKYLEVCWAGGTSRNLARTRPVIARNTYIQALLNQLEAIDNKGLFFQCVYPRNGFSRE